MNVKEYAEENGMTQTEVKEMFGLTHWKQEVVADAPEVKEVKPDGIEECDCAPSS